MPEYPPASEEEMEDWEQKAKNLLAIILMDSPLQFYPVSKTEAKRILRLRATIRERDARWKKLKAKVDRYTEYAKAPAHIKMGQTEWEKEFGQWEGSQSVEIFTAWMTELEKEQADADRPG